MLRVLRCNDVSQQCARGGRVSNNLDGALLHDANENITALPMGRQVALTTFPSGC